MCVWGRGGVFKGEGNSLKKIEVQTELKKLSNLFSISNHNGDWEESWWDRTI